MTLLVPLWPNFPLYFLQAGFATTFEISMFVNIISLFTSNLSKTIHIKLANEGRVVLMLKIHGKNILRKAGDIGYIESISSIKPLNIRVTLLVLDKK